MTSIKSNILKWVQYNGASLTVAAVVACVQTQATYDINLDVSITLTEEQICLLEEHGLTYNPDA